MKERTRFLIAAGVFFALVSVLAGLVKLFGVEVLLLIPVVILVILFSLLMISAIENYVVEPIGKWWFHKHGRRWDL